MNVTVREGNRSEALSVEQMAGMAPRHFSLAERVPGTEGQAFDLKSWYEVWSRSKTAEPTHMMVEAADEFQATIPWKQLDDAAVLFAQDGLPLKKGYPVRLYVPNGSSDCLNVKSVVTIVFLHDERLGNEARYGFKNVVTTDEMKMRK